jgi:hypothetical protein
MAAYTTIDDPEAYFQIKTYTGDGSTPSITLDGDTDMQPDVVWIKNRDASGDSHCFFDSVRGATKEMHVELEAAETTDADTLTSFDSDGFALGADVQVNTNTEKYVAWCWKESATAGFDIVQFTGAGAGTVSHSLSAVPHVYIVKCKDASKPWSVYHHKNTAAPETDKLSLHATDATYDSNAYWNDTAPTSSVFSVGHTADVSADGNVFMTYLWRSVQGFSSMGSYIGNGNADGTFVYTGFRPAWVIIKRTDSTTGADWIIMDNKRNTYNPVKGRLRSNLDSDEDSPVDFCDFLSNGLKMRDSSTTTNTSGGTYVYMAFAEAPFVNSNGVPCNAR